MKNVHGCTFLSGSPAKCVNSRAPSQPEANKDVPAARTVEPPNAYSAVAREDAPTAAAKDAVRA